MFRYDTPNVAFIGESISGCQPRMPGNHVHFQRVSAFPSRQVLPAKGSKFQYGAGEALRW
jgi:hypothetical protein